MDGHGHRGGVHLATGDGLVARVGDLIAYARGEDLDALAGRLDSIAEGEWTEQVRAITADIVASGFEGHPSIACVRLEHDRLRVFVYGSITMHCRTATDEQTLDGADSTTWLDMTVHGTPEVVSCGASGGSSLIGLLRDGVVPSGGFLFDPAADAGDRPEWGVDDSVDRPPPVPTDLPEPPVATPRLRLVPTPDVDDADDSADEADVDDEEHEGLFARLAELHRTEPHDPATTISDDHLGLFDELGEPDPFAATTEAMATAPPPIDGGTLAAVEQVTRPVTPQLQGVRCPSGHLTSVRDHRCRTCGVRPHPDAEIEMGDRPTVATILFDDGVALPLDRPAVIGNDAPDDYLIGDEPATVVRVADPDGAIAPVQLEVRLVGWDVEIVDVDPDVATYLRLAGETHSRTRLRQGQPAALGDGAVVEMGTRSFRLVVGPLAESA